MLTCLLPGADSEWGGEQPQHAAPAHPGQGCSQREDHRASYEPWDGTVHGLVIPLPTTGSRP